MILTIFFFVTLIGAFLSFFLLRKSEKELNGTSWLLLSLIAVICMVMIGMGIVGLFPIPINLLTVSIGNLVVALACGGWMIRTKKIQKYRWCLFDIICMLGFIVLVGFIGIRLFGTQLNFIFRNSDAAVHFENAMYFVRNQRLSGMWFASVYSGTMIEALRPFFEQVNYYKIFILADNLALMAELLLFFVLIREFLNKGAQKVAGIIVCLLYFFGYPMVSYLTHFFYWGICVMLIGFVLYMVRMYRTQEIDRRWSVFLMMIGCASVFLCYMLLAPATYIAVFLSLVAVAQKEGKVFTWANVRLALTVFLFPCLFGLYYGFFQWFFKSGMTVSGVIATNGGIYIELYTNFLLMLPLVVYWLFRRFKDRQLNELGFFLLSFIGFTLLIFVLVCKGKASPYYFYKLYYPLWLLFFMVALLAAFELYEHQKEMLYSLLVVVAFFVVMSLGKIEDKVIEHTGLCTLNHSNQYFDIYYYVKAYGSSGSSYDARLLDLSREVIQKWGTDDKNVPLLVDAVNYGYAYWYDAITGEYSADFYGWCYPFDEIIKRIDQQECDYLAIIKNQNFYSDYAAYFNSFDKVYEDDFSVIIDVRRNHDAVNN